MNKKGFTLLELLLVVVIISVLMLALKNFFSLKDRDFIRAQTCVNHIYGEVKNTFDFVSTGRGFYSGGTSTLNFPNKLYTTFDITNNLVSLVYSGRIVNGNVVAGTGNIKGPFSLSGGNGMKYDCYGTSYYVDLTGNNLSLAINNQLIGDLNNPPFMINNSANIFTGESLFYFCDRKNKCKIIGKIQVDKRSSTLKFNRCLLWYDGKNCKKWGQ